MDDKFILILFMGLQQKIYRELKEWDEYTSYLYGYVLGDGNLQKSRPRFVIDSKDTDHMENLAKLIGTRVYYPKNHFDEAIISVTSTVYYNKMLEWGLVPAKSIVGCELNQIPDNQNLRHLIRGLTDSDGCVSVRTKRVGFVWYIEGHSSYMNQLEKLIPFNLERVDGKRNSNIRLGTEAKEKLERIYHWLYDDATIFMGRKKENFDKFMIYKNDSRSRKEKALEYWTQHVDELEKLVMVKTNQEIANIMNVGYGTAFAIMKQLGVK